MSHCPHARVVLQADDRGRISIDVEDHDGTGTGHRFVGPKYDGNPHRTIARRVLTVDDVAEIRAALTTWDEIHDSPQDIL